MSTVLHCGGVPYRDTLVSKFKLSLSTTQHYSLRAASRSRLEARRCAAAKVWTSLHRLSSVSGGLECRCAASQRDISRLRTAVTRVCLLLARRCRGEQAMRIVRARSPVGGLLSARPSVVVVVVVVVGGLPRIHVASLRWSPPQSHVHLSLKGQRLSLRARDSFVLLPVSAIPPPAGEFSKRHVDLYSYYQRRTYL